MKSIMKMKMRILYEEMESENIKIQPTRNEEKNQQQDARR